MALQTIRFMLIENQPIVRAGFHYLAERTPHIRLIAELESAEGLGATYERVQPDLVVMGLLLPGISGLEAIRRLLLRDAQARILAVGCSRSQKMIERAMEAGAAGYIAKACGLDFLREAIENVAAGNHYLTPAIAQHLALSKLRGKRSALDFLNVRELEILRLMTEGRSVSEVAEILNISAKTAHNNLSLIKRKVGARSLSELVRMGFHESAVGTLPSCLIELDS